MEHYTQYQIVQYIADLGLYTQLTWFVVCQIVYSNVNCISAAI